MNFVQCIILSFIQFICICLIYADHVSIFGIAYVFFFIKFMSFDYNQNHLEFQQKLNTRYIIFNVKILHLVIIIIIIATY